MHWEPDRHECQTIVSLVQPRSWMYPAAIRRLFDVKIWSECSRHVDRLNRRFDVTLPALLNKLYEQRCFDVILNTR